MEVLTPKVRALQALIDAAPPDMRDEARQELFALVELAAIAEPRRVKTLALARRVAEAHTKLPKEGRITALCERFGLKRGEIYFLLREFRNSLNN